MSIHPGNLANAVCASGLAGGATVAGAFALGVVVAEIAAWPADEAMTGLLLGIVVAIYAGVVAMFAYLAGALVFGIPMFLLLNRLGWMSPRSAILVGAALSGLAGFVLGQGGMAGPILGGLGAVGGAVAGPVFRKVAYSPY